MTMKAERQQEERTSRVSQQSKHLGENMVDNRKQAIDQSEIIERIQQKTNISVVQRAIVSGVKNDLKTELEIGNDMHSLVQEVFLGSDDLPPIYNLYTEFEIGGGRADLVAINDERGEDGLGDCYVYVGEIKSDSLQWYGRGIAYTQLDRYIDAFRHDPRFTDAFVGVLDFWNPPTNGIPIEGDGYNCSIFIQNRGNGLYTYTGRIKDESITKMENELDDREPFELPYNERPNSSFY